MNRIVTLPSEETSTSTGRFTTRKSPQEIPNATEAYNIRERGEISLKLKKKVGRARPESSRWAPKDCLGVSGVDLGGGGWLASRM